MPKSNSSRSLCVHFQTNTFGELGIHLFSPRLEVNPFPAIILWKSLIFRRIFFLVFNKVTKRLEVPELWITPLPDVWDDNWTSFKHQKESWSSYKQVWSWFFNFIFWTCLFVRVWKKTFGINVYTPWKELIAGQSRISRFRKATCLEEKL